MLKHLVVLCMAVFLLAGCQVTTGQINSGVGAASDAYKGATLSDADAQELGRQTAAEMDSRNSVAKDNAYAKRLAKLTKSLQKEDGLNLNFKVYMVSEVNAFALPDGSIRVFAGLMDLMTEDDELLAIIGHEIGHVKNGDSKDQMQLVYATSAARKSAQAAGGLAGTLSRSQLGELGEAFIHAQYSQKQEYDADAYGFRLLQKYKKDLNAPASAMRKMDALGSSGGMMSTHPNSGDRGDRLAAMAKGQ